jgi:hypothetical protein
MLPRAAIADAGINTTGPVRSYAWTLELKGGLWIPTDSDIKQFFDPCCNIVGEIEFGWLYKQRYHVAVSAGFSWANGSAVGLRSGLPSGDDFSLYTIPLRTDFIYHFSFKDRQLFVPYARAGFDAVVFIEDDPDETITGVKIGVHGGVGLGILLSRIEEQSNVMEADYGVSGVYLNLEGRYAFINGFSSTGLDLSGFYPYLGLVFHF